MKLNRRHKLGLLLARVLPAPWRWKLLTIPSGEVLAANCAQPLQEVKEDLTALLPRQMGSRGETMGGQVFAFEHGYSTHWGANLTCRGELIRDLSRQGLGPERSHFSFGKPRIKNARRLRGTVATLTIEHRSNYMHFLFDVIPRLQAVENLSRPPDYLYIQANLGYQKEILSRMGYRPEQIVDSSENPYIQADTLLVPAYVSNPTMTTKPSVQYVRSRLCKFLDTSPVTPGSCIYISRRDAPRRRILNENELLDQLSLAGLQVEVVTLATLSVDRQIELFQSTDVVVAQMAAGMANLIFAHPDLHLVMLSSPGFSYDFNLKIMEPFEVKFSHIVMSDIGAPEEVAERDITLTDGEIQAIVQAVAKAKTRNTKSASTP